MIDIIVFTMVVLLIVLSIHHVIIAHKNGGGCGGCGSCPYSQSCHKNKEPKEEKIP